MDTYYCTGCRNDINEDYEPQTKSGLCPTCHQKRLEIIMVFVRENLERHAQGKLDGH